MDLKALGKKPEELKPYLGQAVTVEPEGLDSMQGTLTEGPFSYVFSNADTTLQLYAGHPVVVKTADGKEFDFRKF